MQWKVSRWSGPCRARRNSSAFSRRGRARSRSPASGPVGGSLGGKDPAGRLDYPVRGTKVTLLWLPSRFPLGQQLSKVLSRPQRIEARIRQHLGRFLGPLVDGLAQGG